MYPTSANPNTLPLIGRAVYRIIRAGRTGPPRRTGRPACAGTGIRIGGPHSATSHSGSPGSGGPPDALPEVESGALGGSAGGPALDDDVGRPHAAARQVSATSAAVDAVDAIRASRATLGMLQRSAAARRRHRAVGRITGDPEPGSWLLRIRIDQMTRQPRRATLGLATRARPDRRPTRRQATP
jgi:hypothetical protein